MKKVIFSRQLSWKSRLTIQENCLHIHVMIKMMNWFKNMLMQNAMEVMTKVSPVTLDLAKAMFIIRKL